MKLQIVSKANCNILKTFISFERLSHKNALYSTHFIIVVVSHKYASPEKRKRKDEDVDACFVLSFQQKIFCSQFWNNPLEYWTAAVLLYPFKSENGCIKRFSRFWHDNIYEWALDWLNTRLDSNVYSSNENRPTSAIYHLEWKACQNWLFWKVFPFLSTD